MDIFTQQIINGLTLGSVYALVALGYTMVYGIIGLINFAHGDVVMIGAMAATMVAAPPVGGDPSPPPPPPPRHAARMPNGMATARVNTSVIIARLSEGSRRWPINWVT
ncbi:ABC transporter permease subunit, partial [Bordetella pertussis]